jgi:hypothetical protein
MLGVNLFNFIWTPVLQMTAGTLDINPGMVFTILILSFLIHNKFLALLNKLNISYFKILVLFTCFFTFYFISIYFFPSWNVRLNCLVLIGGGGGLFNPIISYIKSNSLLERHRALIMNLFRIPLNLGLILTLFLANFLNPFIICLITGILSSLSIFASLYLLLNN